MNIILIILAAVSILVAIYAAYLASGNNKKLNRLRKRYDYLLRGRGELSMEELIGQFANELDSYKVIKKRDDERLASIEKWVSETDMDQTRAIDDKFSSLAQKLTSYVDSTVTNSNTSMKRLDENVYAQLENLKKESSYNFNQGMAKIVGDLEKFSKDFDSRIKKNEEDNYIRFDDVNKTINEFKEISSRAMELETNERKEANDKLSSMTIENLKAYQKQASVSMQSLDRRLSTQMEDLKKTSDARIKDLEDNTANELKKQVSLLNGQISLSISKIGLVKYNAFEELSGDLSYSLAMLDEHRSGLILTGIYARDNTRTYAKEIVSGRASQPLSPEEEEALNIALER